MLTCTPSWGDSQLPSSRELPTAAEPGPPCRAGWSSDPQGAWLGPRESQTGKEIRQGKVFLPGTRLEAGQGRLTGQQGSVLRSPSEDSHACTAAARLPLHISGLGTTRSLPSRASQPRPPAPG